MEGIPLSMVFGGICEFGEAPPHLIIWMVKLRVPLKLDVEVPLNGYHLHPSFVLDIWTPKTKLCMDVNAHTWTFEL
jgi:hypothetical protein